MTRLIRTFPFAVATLVAIACRGPIPNEVSPLAPRPGPAQPIPGAPGAPIPGAPDPIPSPGPGPTFPPSDAGMPLVQVMPGAELASFHPVQPGRAVPAAPPVDAMSPADGSPVGLPPLPDGGLPPDANRRAE